MWVEEESRLVFHFKTRSRDDWMTGPMVPERMWS